VSEHHDTRTAKSKDDWITPRYITDALGMFDLDPASSAARPWDTAAKHYTPVDDGLSAPWFGRVWLNPPFLNVKRWLEQMALHGRGTALVAARSPETSWFKLWVWGSADAILFLPKRVSFCDAKGVPSNNPGFPVALAAYGWEDVRKLERSGLGGAFVTRWEIK
jgi:hypothetical protein